MKKSMKQPVTFALFFFSALIISSCIDPSHDDDGFLPLPVPTSIAKPEGGLVTAMSGNVTLFFPPGVVKEQINIVVNECDNPDYCNFLLKAISIEPVMLFNSPVMVRLKYDGDLLNGGQSPEKCPLVICSWEREIDYMNRVKERCIPCCINTERKTIEFFIGQTGVFAVGIYNNQDFE